MTGWKDNTNVLEISDDGKKPLEEGFHHAVQRMHELKTTFPGAEVITQECGQTVVMPIGWFHVRVLFGGAYMVETMQCRREDAVDLAILSKVRRDLTDCFGKEGVHPGSMHAEDGAIYLARECAAALLILQHRCKS